MVLVWFKIFFFTFFNIHASIAAIEEKTFPFVRTTGNPSSLTSLFVASASLSLRYSVISFQPFKMGVVNSSLLNGYFEHDRAATQLRNAHYGIHLQENQILSFSASKIFSKI